MHLQTWSRRTLLLLPLLAIPACSSPAVPAPALSSDPRPAVVAPSIVTVRLDVTGTGTGTIRYTSDTGPRRATKTVLYGWSYTYVSASDAPIVLEVRNRADLTADCAVHVDGRLRASDSGINPICTVTQA